MWPAFAWAAAEALLNSAVASADSFFTLSSTGEYAEYRSIRAWNGVALEGAAL